MGVRECPYLVALCVVLSCHVVILRLGHLLATATEERIAWTWVLRLAGSDYVEVHEECLGGYDVWEVDLRELLCQL